MVVIGRVVRTFGSEGWLSIEPHTDCPERFQELDRVYLAQSPDEKFPLPLAIVGLEYTSGRVMMSFAGVTDTEGARGLIDYYLLIPEDERFQLPQNRFYVDDLVGLEVISPEGTLVGRVESVVNNPGNDLLVISKTGSDAKVLLPMVKSFVKEIDLSKEQVVVIIPPGLEEI